MGNDFTTLGSVCDPDGNLVEVFRDEHGTVLIEHVMGSVEIEAGWLTAFRELLDRAAMPGRAEVSGG